MIKFDKPQIMGVLNVTPDSFSDGHCHFDVGLAVARAKEMINEGATLIDIGGESTRPGAHPVPVELELQRVIPVLSALIKETDVPISVDTSKPEVMLAAIEVGASMINDIFALRMPGALEAVKYSDAYVCLMHMQGEPRSMQEHPNYQNVLQEVGDFLQERIDACLQAGIKPKRIVLDPGFGFGKTVQHNLQLIRHFDELCARFNYPIMVGVSRKSTVGAVLDAPVDERLAGSLALTVLALERGARIIRTHDVRATQEAVKMTWATLGCDALL